MNFDLSKITDMLILYAPRVLGAVVTLIIGFWLAGLIAKKTRQLMERNNVDATLIPFIHSLITITIKVLVLFSAASMFGIEVTSFIAIFGALAFAIGLALQGNLGHLAAGVLILFFKPFRVGDFIVTNSYSGTVKEIQIFNTILTTLDNRIIIIPNGLISSNPLENLTANPTRIVPMTFGIGYSQDIDKARSVIKKVAESCEFIDHSQPIDILVSELGSSAVNFTVRPWCKTENFWNVHFFMHENIKKTFDKENIGIPFPQRDVHLYYPEGKKQ